MARPINLADVLEVLADHVGERVALITNEAEHTFADLDERTNRLANHLLAAGLGPGEHVGIHAANRIEWVEAFFACFKIGAVPINVNYRYVAEELRYLYGNAQCAAVIVSPAYRAALDEVLGDLPEVRHVLTMGAEYEAALAAASPQRPPATRSADSLYVLYTGGTTGMPKGVMWRNEDIILAAMNAGRGGRAIEDMEQLGRDAAASASQLRMMGMGPLMHGGAQWTMGNALLAGSCYVLYTLDRFDPHEVWALAARTKVNTISTMGDAMARPLAEALAEEPGRYDLSALFLLGNGGAPLTPKVKAQLREVLPNLAIMDSYGASETGAAGSRADSGDGGAPRFNVGEDTTVLDDRGEQCAVGEIGKLARSGRIPLGYFRDEAKTAATFPTFGGKRWVIPGDFARIEDDGSISVLGRGSGCINTGGEKVFPEEVEAALKHHPAVLDVAVVGTPNERWGEQVTALVTFRDGMHASTAELVAEARRHIADYKAPKTVLVVEEIGRTPVGKVDYRWAKQTATEGVSAQG